MKLKFKEETLELSYCAKAAFKGDDEKVIKSLLECLKSDGYDVVDKNEKNETTILFKATIEMEQLIKYVNSFKGLKAVGLCDGFDVVKRRHSYVLYSEEGKKNFTKFTYIGWCDGQDDFPFSEQVDLLSSKKQNFSGMHSMTGTKWKVSYAFPYELEWNGNYDEAFVVDGKTLVKYKGDLKTVVIPDGVVEIGSKAFENCKTVCNLVLPKSVKRIRNFAFLKCVNLKGISFSEGLEFLGDFAFSECHSLTEVVLPNSLNKYVMHDVNSFKYTSQSVFRSCKNLKSVTLGNKMKKIPSYWFRDCKNLEFVILPQCLEEIENSSFENCSSLEKIELPEGLKKIGGSRSKTYSFARCIKLKDVNIPSSVTQISDGTFAECKSLTLRVYKGSEGEKHANKNKINFEYL